MNLLDYNFSSNMHLSKGLALFLKRAGGILTDLIVHFHFIWFSDKFNSDYIWRLFIPSTISRTGSGSLRPGHQRHRHVGAAPVAGAQRQRRRPGILSVLLRGKQTELGDSQQQASHQNQVMECYLE